MGSGREAVVKVYVFTPHTGFALQSGMEDHRWIDSGFFLPRGNHLPVEIELVSGKREKRDTTEGDWRFVKRWRMVEGKKKGKD